MNTECPRWNCTMKFCQVIVPMKEVASVKDGKKRVQERPSYPGYILIQSCHELGPEVEEKVAVVVGT